VSSKLKIRKGDSVQVLAGKDAGKRGTVSVVIPGSRRVVVDKVNMIKRHTKPRSRRSDPALRGLMPAGVSAEHLGPFDYYYWDDFWSLRGLLDGAELLPYIVKSGRDLFRIRNVGRDCPRVRSNFTSELANELR